VRSAETKHRKIRSKQLGAIAAHRAAKTDEKRAYWQQQYDAALDAEDDRSRVKSSAWAEEYAQGRLERARDGSLAPWNTSADSATDQAQNVPPVPTAAPPLVRDGFSGVVAEVVEELDAAGIPPSLERVWRAGDKGKRIKSVSERLAPKKITRTRVEAELRTLGKTLEKNRPKKSREKSPK